MGIFLSAKSLIVFTGLTFVRAVLGLAGYQQQSTIVRELIY